MAVSDSRTKMWGKGGFPMPVKPKYPGVYIEKIPSIAETITGEGTSTAVFLGRAPRGPVDEPTLINSFADYQRLYGGLHANYPLSQAVKDHYASGGKQALIVRLSEAAGSRVEDLHDRGELGPFLESNGLKKLN
jgi:hypothetical protein